MPPYALCDKMGEVGQKYNYCGGAMKKRALFTFILIVAIAISGLYLLKKSSHPLALKAKAYAKHVITKAVLPPLFNEQKWLAGATEKTFYKGGAKVIATDATKRFINYSEGFYFDVPDDFVFETNRVYTTANSDRGSVTVSREWSFEKNVDEYIAHYLNRFILSPQFRESNNISMFENYAKDNMQVITVAINDLPPDKFDKYTYIIIKTKTPNFYRLMFKYKSIDRLFHKQVIDETIKTFKYFSPNPKPIEITEFEPVIPDFWSDETSRLYDKIKGLKSLNWGIFAQDIYNDGINNKVPELEKKLNYKFGVVLSYLQFGERFPIDFMRKNYENNKLVELTYQITSSNNEELFGYTPFIDIYRGKHDAQIRSFAKEAKEFAMPFLFRLCNEPNSDWTSYSAVVNMSDPEIYIANWRRIYNIFKEEGVDNAIWIFNPNDKNYPPCNWNDFTAFYPGNEFVHMIGVTGYNTGTYYKTEKWREFENIYDDISKHYLPTFEKFPWIITEFATSSVGGNKPLWIRKMFTSLYKYPQIKIAVWFSYADFEVHTDDEKIVSRPYWLDETPNTTEEFKKGLQNFNSEALINH